MELKLLFTKQELATAFEAAGVGITPEQVEVVGSKLFEKIEGAFGFSLESMAPQVAAPTPAQAELALKEAVINTEPAAPKRGTLEYLNKMIASYLEKHPVVEVRRFEASRNRKCDKILDYLNGRSGPRNVDAIASLLTVSTVTAIGYLADLVGMGVIETRAPAGRAEKPTFALTQKGIETLKASNRN